MKIQRILVLHFANLNNYGSGMMGLVTIQALADRFGTENVEFYCDFNAFANIAEIKSELRSDVILKQYINAEAVKIQLIKNSLIRKTRILINLLFTFEGKGFDKVIVLGGDDLSEYYSKYDAGLELFCKWKMTFRTRVILLGQTIGPFANIFNRLAVRYLLPSMTVFTRDQWCTRYISEEFGGRVNQMADLALSDLPKQSDVSIEIEILNSYELHRNEYFTFVISGLQSSNYYCNSLKVYLDRYSEMILAIAMIPQLEGKKICLLAHTFPPFANEANLINSLYSLFPEKIRDRIILVNERILQTRARFILGNGLFTVTGRMHAAVSTFQMGKPAVCLSYSAKYKGVIGDSIGRNDLIIEANDSNMWDDGSIVIKVQEKVNYLLANYTLLLSEIKNSVNNQKMIINEKFDQLSVLD